jgi:Domain of unknown function (DUF5658)
MHWRIALFLGLNAIDLGLSQYFISSGAAVQEGNPFLNVLWQFGGWQLVWTIKMGASAIIALLICSLFPRHICNRMMSALCIGFALVAVYLLGVAAWSHLEVTAMVKRGLAAPMRKAVHHQPPRPECSRGVCWHTGLLLSSRKITALYGKPPWPSSGIEQWPGKSLHGAWPFPNPNCCAGLRSGQPR